LLRHRLLSGTLIGATLIAASFMLPVPGIYMLLVTISGFAQREFYNLAEEAGVPVFRRVGVLAGTALITATYLNIGPSAEAAAKAYRWETTVLVFSLIYVFVRQFPQKNNPVPLATIGCTLLGLWYVPFLFNFFTRLLFSWDGAQGFGQVSATGRWLVLYLVAVVKATDTGAYFVGRWIGRRKLFPRISPSKTWEGLFGGIAAAVAASFAMRALSGGHLGAVPLSAPSAVLLGVLLGVSGVVGDMFESLLKRSAGAKDSSRVVPGMGGILDVLDSLLFAGPTLYFYVRWCATNL
jgi:phosphatidate cytidylyltransferase